MKYHKYLLAFILTAGVLLACDRDYKAPPLTEPIYTGEEANMTIAELKSMYADITTPTEISGNYILKAYVTANDISGNIFKQLYIQDETGGIYLGVDQNSVYSEFRVGQELYIDLQSLYMVKYGGQLNIGYGGTTANRIPWEIFNFYTFRNKWPYADNVKPKTTKLNELNDNLAQTLVRIDNVYFADGGKLPFSEAKTTTNRILKDGNGNSIIVRNSNYANFAANILPEGGGSIVGILSKYNADWQLFLRSKDDCINFGQAVPGEDPGSSGGDVTTYYLETFGTGDVSGRPKIADYTGFDNKSVKYSDASGNVDVRSIKSSDGPHLWFPKEKNGYFKIEGIDTSAGAGEELSLNYEIAASLFDSTNEMNLNAMTVKVNEIDFPVPSQFVSNANGDNNKAYTVKLKGIPALKNLTVQFFAEGSKNTCGLRIDNISITTAKENDVIVIVPK